MRRALAIQKYVPAVLCGLLVTVCLRESKCRAQDTNVQAIEAAWKRREATFASFEVRWTRDIEMHIAATDVKRDPFRGAPLPLSEQILSKGQLAASLTMSGDKLRWEDELPATKPGNPRFDGSVFNRVSDGKKARQLRQNTLPGTVPWQGGGMTHERVLDHLATSVEVQPIIDQFRPFLRMKQHLKEGKLLPDTITFEDRTCVVLEWRKRIGAQEHVDELWISPAEDFAIRRVVSRFNGAIVRSCERRYRTAPGLLILDSWKYIRNRDGVRDQTTDGRVTYFALNPEVSKETFELVFPPNAFDSDR